MWSNSIRSANSLSRCNHRISRRFATRQVEIGVEMETKVLGRKIIDGWELIKTLFFWFSSVGTRTTLIMRPSTDTNGQHYGAEPEKKGFGSSDVLFTQVECAVTTNNKREVKAKGLKNWGETRGEAVVLRGRGGLLWENPSFALKSLNEVPRWLSGRHYREVGDRKINR